MGGVAVEAGSRGSTARMRGWSAGFRCSEARALRGTAARSSTPPGRPRGEDPRVPPDPREHLGAEPHTERTLLAEPRFGSSWISPWRRNFRRKNHVGLRRGCIRNALKYRIYAFLYFTEIKGSSLHILVPFIPLNSNSQK